MTNAPTHKTSHTKAQNDATHKPGSDQASTDPTSAEQLPFARWRPVLWGIGAVAAVFCIIVIVMMADAWLTRQQHMPVPAQDELHAIRTELRADSDNVALQDKLRQADLEVRKQYFHNQDVIAWGGYLLLGGVILMLTSFRLALAAGDPGPPLPAVMEMRKPDPIKQRERAQVSIISVFMIAALVAGFVIGWVISRPDRPELDPERLAIKQQGKAGDGAAAPAVIDDTPVTRDELLANWGRLRGPFALGRATTKQAPLWDEAENKAIAWKVPIALPGASSPIAWGERIFLTGADKRRQVLYCFNLADGKLLWEKPVGDTPFGARDLTIYDNTMIAASTPATDGRRVYAIFAAGDIAAFDFNGNKLWEKNLGVPEDDSGFGYGSSLTVHDGNLIVQYDMGEFADLIALKGSDGSEAWRSKRPVGVSWATPTVIETEKGTQIVSLAAGALTGHDAGTGKLLWEVQGFEPDSDGTLAASPIECAGLVIALDPDMNELVAVKPDGSGNVTETHVAWRFVYDDGLAAIPTPITDGKLIYAITAYGFVAIDPKTGKQVWKGEHDDFSPGYPSPVIIGDQLFAFGDSGWAHAVALGDTYKHQGIAKLKEGSSASPAVHGGYLIIRTNGSLYAIKLDEKGATP